MKLDDLKQTLEQALSSLPAQAVSQAQEEASFLDLSQDPDDSRWKRLLAGALRDARRFELHCWNEEADCLALALKYGALQASDWQFGKIVSRAAERRSSPPCSLPCQSRRTLGLTTG